MKTVPRQVGFGSVVLLNMQDRLLKGGKSYEKDFIVT